MSKNFDLDQAFKYLTKWQKILRLQDWDINLYKVEKEWRKTGDIKIDDSDRKAVVMLNMANPKQENLEEVVIHELLHLKIWHLDQMVDNMIVQVFGEDESDPKYQFAYDRFMEVLETTVEDLTKSFLSLVGENKRLSFGRVNRQIAKELGIKDQEVSKDMVDRKDSEK